MSQQPPEPQYRPPAPSGGAPDDAVPSSGLPGPVGPAGPAGINPPAGHVAGEPGQGAWPPPEAPAGPWVTRRELWAGAGIVVGLAAVGVLIGLLWQAISPARPAGFRYETGPVFAFEESESFIASDARFVLLTGAVGLLAGVGAWLVRPWRGPVVVAALGLGGLAGAWLASLVGQLTGGGTTTAPARTLIKHLPLQVHARGLMVVEAVVALLAYLLLALFASRDDLGRPAEQQPPTGPAQPLPYAAYGWPPAG